MCCSHSIEKDKEEKKTLEAFDLSSVKGMKFFDPHVHMTSRTTDDYQAMLQRDIHTALCASLFITMWCMDLYG